MARTPKRTVMKAHEIAKAIKRRGTHGVNPYAVGMAQAKRSAAKRRGKRRA